MYSGDRIKGFSKHFNIIYLSIYRIEYLTFFGFKIYLHKSKATNMSPLLCNSQINFYNVSLKRNSCPSRSFQLQKRVRIY